jgi:hypothetical protein
MLIYLAEIEAYDASISGVRTLYFSTHGFTSKASDTPASTFYEPKLKQPGLMRRDVFSKGSTGGASTTGYGLIELVNLGTLDSMADYGFDGRNFRVLLGDSKAARASFTTVIKGTMEQPEFTWQSLTIRIRDRLAELDRPIQTTLYAGSNALPAGLEGTADDLKGKPKPKLYGKVFNVSPPIVNTARLIYQLNDGPLASLDQVYDQGVALTAGAVYSSQADMETNAPSAGTYRAWLAGGYFRLGSTPAGPITASATQGSVAADRTAAQIIKSIVTGPGGIAAGDIVAADVTALDSATGSATLGIYLSENETINSALDALSNSVGAWYSFDRLGQFRMAQLNAPSGASVATFTQQEIIDIERTATADTDKGVPAYQVRLGYAKNFTVITSGLATSVGAAFKAWLAEDYRTVFATDSSVLTAHLLSPVLSFDSLLTDSGAAQTEATRRLNLYKNRKDRINLTVKVLPGTTDTIDLGNVVTLKVDRFGYTLGKLFRVIGIQPDYRIGTLDLTLWG